MANAQGNWHSAGPDVQIVSKVGAGDSFVGAFTLSQSRGEAPEISLRFGVAAVCATLTTAGTKFCDLETTQKLLDACTLQPL